MPSSKTQITFGFLLLPGFPMACLTSLIEPLRAANEITGVQNFQWRLLSESGEAVSASAGVVFQPEGGLTKIKAIDRIIILAAPNSKVENPTVTYGALRHLARHGTPVGAISGGVFHLARAGLLNGQKTSVHWCYATAFTTEFPALEISDDVLVLNQSLSTASGAAAALDLMLHIIEGELGAEVATETACWFQHPVMRGEGVRQRVPSINTANTADDLPKLVKGAFEIFSKNLQYPVSIGVVAKQLNVSSRQLERSFQDVFKVSPGRYYRALRLRAARQLVLFSNKPINSIAEELGFSSPSAFAKSYCSLFGVLPKQDRRKASSFRVNQNLPIANY